MEAIRTSFRTFGNVSPIEDEVKENYLSVFSIKVIPWFLTNPFDFELEFPCEVLELDFESSRHQIEDAKAIISKNTPTPNGTEFEVEIDDSGVINLRAFRTIEFGDLVLLVDWRLRSTVEGCTLSVEILEKDPEREGEIYLPCSIYSEGLVEGDEKPFVQRLVSLFEHIRP